MGPEESPGQVKPEQGSLFCLHPDRSVTTHVEKVSISNGLAWSHDRKTMYYIDSLELGVDAFDYDLATGAISTLILCFASHFKSLVHVLDMPMKLEYHEYVEDIGYTCSKK